MNGETGWSHQWLKHLENVNEVALCQVWLVQSILTTVFFHLAI